MSKATIELGRRGEKTAVNFLKNNGYDIISTDYRTRLGQIDIIAREKDTICFIEVKTRRSLSFGQPNEAVGYLKQKKISKVALGFLKENQLLDSPARFDVISIFYVNPKPKVELLKNAFDLDCRYFY